MSTAKQRAAAHVAAVVAAGHSIAFVPGAGRAGRGGVVTTLDVSEPHPLSPETEALSNSFRHGVRADNRALVAELIQRGWVLQWA